MSKKVVAAALVTFAVAAVIGIHPPSKGQEKKPKGRLPPYYSSIVTEQQREVIYAIQVRYTQQLAALQGQIEALEKQRDLDIENVLSPQQKQLLTKALADAAAKRKKSADEKIAVKVAELEAAKAPPADAKDAKKARGRKKRINK